MSPEGARLMADYNAWMNRRLYAAALTLPPERQVQDMGAFFGSLLGTLNHLVVTDLIWLRRFSQDGRDPPLAAALATLPAPTALREPLAASIEVLRPLREQIDALILDWTARLDAAMLAAPLAYRNVAGAPQQRPFGALLQHVFNHQTHHRGQASTLLCQAGVDLGVTDLLAVIPNAA